ncbi:hypothetical protein [Roseovarius dicentrarchi]|uniref:hypothetical protein n=1 Tax=Roseovarius dicentrarchi TaxID=2250573 RepID=UPI0013966710|nr:hypothetical protein [Roseovarius dicentrarchi]
MTGVLQGYSAWRSTGIGAVAALVMGLLLLFGSFAEGSLLCNLLGLLLLVSGAAKLWFSRPLRNNPLFLMPYHSAASSGRRVSCVARMHLVHRAMAHHCG